MRIPLRFLLLVIALLLGGSLFAQQSGEAAAAPSVNEIKGGFVSPSRPYYRIRDVRVLPNGSVIELSGFISQRINGDNYLFREPDQNDRAGNLIVGDRIVIEIDDDLWQGQVVRTADQVQIVGEVNRSDGIATIRVEKVIKDLDYARRREALNARYRDREQRRLRIEGQQDQPASVQEN